MTSFMPGRKIQEPCLQPLRSATGRTIPGHDCYAHTVSAAAWLPLPWSVVYTSAYVRVIFWQFFHSEVVRTSTANQGEWICFKP